MKIVLKGSQAPECECGWKLPKTIAIVPSLVTRAFLSGPKATVRGFVDRIEIVCPTCGNSTSYSDAEIVKSAK